MHEQFNLISNRHGVNLVTWDILTSEAGPLALVSVRSSVQPFELSRDFVDIEAARDWARRATAMIEAAGDVQLLRHVVTEASGDE